MDRSPDAGVLDHDGWVPYRHYDGVAHQLCTAHHLRELAAAAQTDGQTWASDTATLLSDAWHLVLEAKDDGQHRLDDQEMARIRTNFRAVIDVGCEVNLPPVPTCRRGWTKRSKANNL